MGDTAQVLIQIRGDVGDINAKLADLRGNIGRISEDTRRTADLSRHSWAAIATGINQAIEASRKFVDGIRRVAGVALDMAAAAGEAEREQVKLGAVLAAHGVKAPEVAQAYKDIAERLMELTGHEDETVKSAMAMMTAMGVLPSKMEPALKAALDLATVFGMSIPDASRIVVQAMEGNYRGLVKIIPALKGVEQGALDADAVLRKIQQAVGGSAAAEAETYAAKVRGLKTSFGELKEVLGEEIIPTLKEMISLVKDGILAIRGLAGDTSTSYKRQQLSSIEKQIAELEKGGAWVDFKTRATTATDPKIVLEKLRAQAREIAGEIREAERASQSALKTGDSQFIKEPSHARDEKLEKARAQWASMLIDMQAELDKVGAGTSDLDRRIIEVNRRYDESIAKLVEMKLNDEEHLGVINRFRDQIIGLLKLEAQWQEYNEQRLEDLKDEQLRADALFAKVTARIQAESTLESARLALRESRGEDVDLVKLELDYRTKTILIEEQIAKIKDDITRADEDTEINLLAQKAVLEDQKKVLEQIYAIQKQMKDEAERLRLDPAAGWARGWEDAMTEWESFGKHAYELARGTAQNMSNAFGDLFFDVFEGKVKNLGDYMTDFAKNVLRQISDILGQMAAMYVVKGTMGGVSMLSGLFAGGGGMDSTWGAGGDWTFHKGGVVGGRSFTIGVNPDLVPRRHDGGLAPNERLTVNKVGERYITEEQNSWLTGIARMMKGAGGRGLGEASGISFTPEQMKGLAGMMSSSMSFNMPITMDDPLRAKQLKRNLEREAKKTIRGWL